MTLSKFVSIFAVVKFKIMSNKTVKEKSYADTLYKESKLVAILEACKDQGLGLEYILYESKLAKITLNQDDLEEISFVLDIPFQRVQYKLLDVTDYDNKVRGIIEKQKVKTLDNQNKPIRR